MGSELSGGQAADQPLPADRLDAAPDRAQLATHGEYRLTDLPVTRMSWRDIELDDKPVRNAAGPETGVVTATSSDQETTPDGREESPFARLPDTPGRDEWTETLGAPVEAPEAQDLTEKPEWASRLDRARQTAFRTAEELSDAVGKGADHVKANLEGRPPTGQPETRSPRPTYEVPQHHGVDAGDASASILLTTVVVAEGARRAMEHWLGRRQGKGNTDAGHQ